MNCHCEEHRRCDVAISITDEGKSVRFSPLVKGGWIFSVKDRKKTGGFLSPIGYNKFLLYGCFLYVPPISLLAQRNGWYPSKETPLSPLRLFPQTLSPVGDKIITGKSAVSNIDSGRVTGLRPVRNDLRFPFRIKTQLRKREPKGSLFCFGTLCESVFCAIMAAENHGRRFLRKNGKKL